GVGSGPRRLGEAAPLGRGAREAFCGVVVGEPSIALGGRALEHGIDVPADQNGRARLLHGFWVEHRTAQPEGWIVAVDLLLGPEPVDDLEALFHDLAALMELRAK